MNIYIDINKELLIHVISISNNKPKLFRIDRSAVLREVPINNLANEYTQLGLLDELNIYDIGNSCLVLGHDQIYQGKKDANQNSIFYSKNRTLIKCDFNQYTVSKKVFSGIIHTIQVEDNGHLWIGTRDGLFLFNNGNLEEKSRVLFENMNIIHLTIDKESNYWVTTQDNGVFLIPALDIHAYRTSDKRLNTEKVLSVVALKDHIIFGTSNSNFFYFNKQFQFYELPTVKKSRGQISFGMKSNEEALFSFGYLVKENQGKLHVDYLDSNYVTMFKTSNGDKIMCAYPGISIIDRDKNTIKTNKLQPDFLEWVKTIKEDSLKNIWFGTGNGLFVTKNFNYSVIEKVFPNNPILNTRISDVQTDKHGNIWLSTIGNGLLYVTKDTVFQINESNGLNSNLLNCLTLENDSTLWIGSNSGLNKLSFSWQPKKLEIEYVNALFTEGGLLSNFINDLVIWKDHIWVATNQGVNYFCEADVLKDFPSVPIYLDKVEVNDMVFIYKTRFLS